MLELDQAAGSFLNGIEGGVGWGRGSVGLEEPMGSKSQTLRTVNHTGEEKEGGYNARLQRRKTG